MGNHGASSPTVYNGRACLRSMDNNVHCLDGAGNGNGKVYIGLGDGNVNCFGSTRQEIPALSEQGMIVLALLFAVGKVAAIRRRQAAVRKQQSYRRK